MKAYELIERGWTQGAFARNQRGEEVMPRDHDAIEWCLIGALRAAYGASDLYDVIYRKVQEKIDTTKYIDMAEWNDSLECTQVKVVAVLKDVEDAA